MRILVYDGDSKKTVYGRILSGEHKSGKALKVVHYPTNITVNLSKIKPAGSQNDHNASSTSSRHSQAVTPGFFIAAELNEQAACTIGRIFRG